MEWSSLPTRRQSSDIWYLKLLRNSQVVRSTRVASGCSASSARYSTPLEIRVGPLL